VLDKGIHISPPKPIPKKCFEKWCNYIVYPKDMKASERRKFIKNLDSAIEHYYSYCRALGFQDNGSTHGLIEHYNRWCSELEYTIASGFNKALQPK
jgi:hypothetical protein